MLKLKEAKRGVLKRPRHRGVKMILDAEIKHRASPLSDSASPRSHQVAPSLVTGAENGSRRADLLSSAVISS